MKTQLRSLAKEAESLTSGDGDRFLNFGVEIRTVKKSKDGAEPAPGLPKVVEVGERLRVGGKLDTLARRYVGPCDEWRVWYVGARQREIIDQFLDQDAKQNILLYSAEGGGKTVLSAMLCWICIMSATADGRPGSIGALAPTHRRLGTLQKALCDLAPVDSTRSPNPSSWGTFFTDAGDLKVRSGHTIQLRSTKQQSAATGAVIQGYSWVSVVIDEIQDQLRSYPDIVARLRAAKRAQIVATATAKDSSEWRGWRDALSDNWEVAKIKYTETPFVHDSHWELLKAESSKREWDRRALALDVPPEDQIYSTFERADSVGPIPPGYVDVTETVLAKYGKGLRVLVGHDPGQTIDVSVFLKAYKKRGSSFHVWYVVDEVITKGTTQVHIEELLSKLQKDYECNTGIPGLPQCHLRADPYGDRPDGTHRTVYTQFRDAGISIRAAAYSRKSAKPGMVPKEAGIEMVCRLFRDVRNRRRLFFKTDERGRVIASNTIESVELAQRDAAGKAETEKKGTKRDLSHYTAAIRYALWFLERPRMGDKV